MNRTRRDLLWLFLLSLAVRLCTAALIPQPGYMDAAYYAAGAARWARGGGLTEPFLWNYLDDPTGLPHPGFLYWMPLPSLLAAPFAALAPGSFLAQQLPFVLLSALLPLLGYAVAWQASAARRQAWLAGLLTLFSGFFFPYWTLPETFAPFALCGGLALWLVGQRIEHRLEQAERPRATGALLIGALVGLAHLTRPDGPLLLFVALAGITLAGWTDQRTRAGDSRAGPVLGDLLLILLGYLVVMGPWFLRNVRATGAPLSPAGTKTLWLTGYDDLFCYRCRLTPGTYLAWGWDNILPSKLWALGVNLQRFLAENCLVFLLPFTLAGLYRLRRRPSFLLVSVYLILVYLAHSVAFTFPGPRGGFFHASAPTLPFLFAAGAEGLDAAVRWAGRHRRWRLRQAQAVFCAAAVVAAVALSLDAAAAKLPAWQKTDAVYRQAGRWLAQEEAQGAVVMVSNPPAFWFHTGHPAVVVPNEGLETVLVVTDRYGAGYLLLDANRPQPLAGLFAGTVSHPRLRRVAVWEAPTGRAVLFAVEATP